MTGRCTHGRPASEAGTVSRRTLILLAAIFLLVGVGIGWAQLGERGHSALPEHAPGHEVDR